MAAPLSATDDTEEGGGWFGHFVLLEFRDAVILRCALLRASKDGSIDRANHPSRLAEEARTSSDNGEAVARG
jgi:hypothetical protein